MADARFGVACMQSATRPIRAPQPPTPPPPIPSQPPSGTHQDWIRGVVLLILKHKALLTQYLFTHFSHRANIHGRDVIALCSSPHSVKLHALIRRHTFQPASQSSQQGGRGWGGNNMVTAVSYSMQPLRPAASEAYRVQGLPHASQAPDAWVLSYMHPPVSDCSKRDLSRHWIKRMHADNACIPCTVHLHSDVRRRMICCGGWGLAQRHHERLPREQTNRILRLHTICSGLFFCSLHEVNLSNE